MGKFTDQITRLDLSDDEVDAILQSIGASELVMSHMADQSALSWGEFQAVRRAFARVKGVLRHTEDTAALHEFLDEVEGSLDAMELEGTVNVG